MESWVGAYVKGFVGGPTISTTRRGVAVPTPRRPLEATVIALVPAEDPTYHV